MREEAVGRSTLLVGRDAFVALAARRLSAAAAGNGHVLLVSGEAGIGKSRLVASITAAAVHEGFSVVATAAFPGDEDELGGLLGNLAREMVRSGDAGVADVGTAVRARLAATSPAGGDTHHRRRVLLSELAEALAGVQLSAPLLVVVEDLHWADVLSLEVVGRFARQMSTRAVMVVAIFRSDELFLSTPMREWRARLLTQRLAEEIKLPRLTLAQTADVAANMLGSTVPAAIVHEVYDRSDGIPLHIEELLAAGRADSTRHGHAIGDVARAPVPQTLADAVRFRVRTLGPATLAVAEAAAVIGRSFDFDMLVAVSGQGVEAVGESLRALLAAHVVQVGSDDSTFDFRHALLRDSLYADIPVSRRRPMHAHAATLAVERGESDALVSAHFDKAHEQDSAYVFALRAARAAASASSHRESLKLFRRAERNMAHDVLPGTRAELLAAIGSEAAAVDDNAAASLAFAEAHALWWAAGDRRAAAEVVARLVAVMHVLGEARERRVRTLQDALESIEDAPDAERVRAQLLGALAAAFMLDRELEAAVPHARRSCLVAEQVGDEATAIDASTTLGTVWVFSGDTDAGWSLLERALGRAVRGDREAEAARGYRMLTSCASVLGETDRAGHWLSLGVPYAERVELWNHRNYMLAHLGHVQWVTGDWARAQSTSERALTDGRGGITTRITAHYVLGYLALGREAFELAYEHLGGALADGESMGELQRISPPLWGLAEIEVRRGNFAEAADLCRRGFAASAEVADAAYLFPFLVTGTRAWLGMGDRVEAGRWVDGVERALIHRGIPGTLPAIPHARGLLALADKDLPSARSALGSARAAWAARRRFWEGSWAALDMAQCASLARKPGEARALAEAVDEVAKEAGATALSAAAHVFLDGEQSGSVQRWHPLTSREYEVAVLVTAGLTNRQIAAELVVAPKTVSAHVEHILGKLGVARRAEVAAWVARIGP